MDSHELADLLAGRLPAERYAVALAHVETCSECSKSIDKLGQSTGYSWLGKAIKADKDSGFAHEPECEALVGRLLVEPFARAAQPLSGAVPIETLGPYRLLRWLGSGGMGAVYLGEHQRLKKLVAIKLLPREKLWQADWLERFNREMTSIAALEHPYVVRAIDAGEEGGWHYLVMEYLDGLDLAKVCRRMGQLPIAGACELMRQAALGLSAIHQLDMIHRDIKPSNMFVTKTGQLKLLDLGLVQSGDSPLASDERLTTVGHLMGTLPYMSREQILDASSVDQRADIYSLGASFFHVLTGRAPFGRQLNIARLIQAVTTETPPPVQEVRPDVPDHVARLIDRMLSPDAHKRPQAASDIAEELSGLADDSATVELMRTALNRQDELAEAQLEPSRTLPRDIPASTRSNSRWPTWLALMLLPLAFIAGIIITVVTDKGTLVIESEEPGVSVKVTQGEKVVEELTIEKQPSVLRLSSGKYLIELSGDIGDKLQVSESKIVLLRGEKQVVKIGKATSTTLKSTSQDSTLPGSDQDPGNLYQGKPLAYWMDMLEREKDVAVLASAMQATQLLATTDKQRMEAAKKSLINARRLGGMYVSFAPKDGGSSTDQTGWFMTELTMAFPNFFPQPGLKAILEELDEGNLRSTQACLWLLEAWQNSYEVRSRGNHLLLKHLKAMGTPDSPLADIQRLDTILHKRGEEQLTPTLTGLRYDLAVALGKDPSQDMQLVSGAKTILTTFDRQLNPVAMGQSQDRSPLTPYKALMLHRILPGESHPAIVLGLLEPSSADQETELTLALAELAQKHPQQVAAAISQHFARSNSWQGKEMKPGEPGKISQRAATALKILISNAQDTLEVTRHIMHAANQRQADIFTEHDLRSAVMELAVRLAHEANAPGETKVLRKVVAAVYIAANVGIPEGKGVETIELILRRYPSETVPVWSNRMPPWDDIARYVERMDDELTDQARDGLPLSLNKLFEERPAEFLQAYTNLLGSKSDFQISVTYHLQRLFNHLNERTAMDRRLIRRDETPQSGSFTTMLLTPEGMKILEQLELAYDRALGRFLDLQGSTTLDAIKSFELCTLSQHRLIIAAYRDVVPADRALVERALQLLLTDYPEGYRPDATIPFGLLHYYGEQFGYEDVELDAFMATMEDIAKWQDRESIDKVVRGLHAAHPDEFCQYFIRYLERFAEDLEKPDVHKRLPSERALKLFGDLFAQCRGWHYEILKPMLANPATKERTRTAIKMITKHMSSSTHYLLDKVLE